MTKQKHVSETPATQWLRKHRINFSEHTYQYIDHGGTHEAARQLQLELHLVAKTLVMEDENAKALIIIMRGDRDVSTKNLARQIGAKKVAPCKPEVAQRHTAYQVGGTSPFGIRKPLAIYVEADLLSAERIYINGGRRGYLVGIAPNVLTDVLGAKAVEVGI